MPTSKTQAALRRVATRWARQLTAYAKEFAPQHLRPYIHSRSEQKGEGSYTITVSVDMGASPAQKYGSLDARAQEYGSGLRISAIRSPLSSPQKYPIFPKPGHRFLAFNWEVADANPEKFRFLPDGRVLLSKVMHPGIFPYKGIGYLGPAVEELNYTGRKELDLEMQQAITGDLRLAFKHAK